MVTHLVYNNGNSETMVNIRKFFYVNGVLTVLHEDSKDGEDLEIKDVFSFKILSQ